MANETNSAGEAPSPVTVTADEALAFARRLLVSYKLPEDDADIVARCLVRGDLRGVDTHGLILLPLYLERLRLGLVNPNPELKIEHATLVTASLDGQNGFGHLVATRAMEAAIEMARQFGIGIVSVRQSTHFGMAANYVLQAAEAGFISLVFTNASPAMPPWGGREAIIGTSPFAAGAPGGERGDYILDMSPAVVARGKIRRAARRNEPLPLGYALDKDGRPTTDAKAALEGVLLPIGGPKGSALSMLMDIFGGVISGAAFAGNVGNQFDNFDSVQNVGHFFMAMKPDAFLSKDEYLARMDVLTDRVHDCPTADGFTEVLMPGEIEQRLEVERRASGIPYNQADLAKLNAEAARAGVAPLQTI